MPGALCLIYLRQRRFDGARVLACNNWGDCFPKTLQPMSMALILITLTACGSSQPATQSRVEVGQTEAAPVTQAAPSGPSAPQQSTGHSLATRLAAVDQAVDRWARASTLAAAKDAAEEARNLIVGASGPSYGDANGDGDIAGAAHRGLLPGLKGETGLADLSDNACVIADVLGGSWRQPAKRWSQMQSAIARWTPARNTFPSLPSHAQRVVAWASLTLKTGSLSDAHEYASHARLHVDISLRAVTSCSS